MKAAGLQGMLMRKRREGAEVEVLCLYWRHVIKCVLIVKIFTGQKVKMPKAGKIYDTLSNQVWKNFSGKLQQHTHTHPESTAALSIPSEISAENR